MYISFVYEVPVDVFRFSPIIFDNVYLDEFEVKTNIGTFLEKFGFDEYKRLFDIIGIEYLDISQDGLSYKISSNGKEKKLSITMLSSGERIILYAAIMSRLNKVFIILGLADRLDKNHREILIEHSELFTTTVILAQGRTSINQDFVNKFYKPFNEVLDSEIGKKINAMVYCEDGDI